MMDYGNSNERSMRHHPKSKGAHKKYMADMKKKDKAKDKLKDKAKERGFK
jgi:hypothetical protein